MKRPCHAVIVTPYFWPILASSTHLMKDLAEGLAESGLTVTVLTNAPATRTDVAQDHPRLQGRIHRGWNPFVRRLGVVPKACEYAWFLAYFVLRGLFIPRIDLIFVASTPPLAGLPAALLARLKGAKLVYNLQDLFPDSAVVGGMLSAASPLYRILRRAEALTYRLSDRVSAISPTFSEHVHNLAPGTRVDTVENWVDTDHIRPLEATEDPTVAALRQGGGFVVQYAGNMGLMQNLEVILQAAQRLQEVRDILFVFIGDGNAKAGLEALAREQGLANCIFLPMQPLERVPSVYNACDVGVIPLKPGAAHIAVPSKTWNYLAAGRPVIGCVEDDSPLAAVIRDSGSGSVVPPSDAEALAQATLGYRNSPERVRADGQRGRAHVEAHLSRRIAVARFARMFNEMTTEEGT
jgi:colanic acid biosynthesis glycosyl transferase WcaI